MSVLRRLTVLLTALMLILPAAGARAANAPPVFAARAYLLMDATTGQVLYAVEGETILPMASTTKIMTAILALEKGKLSDVVTAGQKPYDTGGSTIYLDLGEQQSMQNLLYALMLESANDAAVAIAEHLGGTEEQFVALMNAKAKEIGATRTHFVNSHGLHNPDHYTTARDLALIARYAMQNPDFRKLVTTEEATIPAFKETDPPRKLYNHNRLLGYYNGITGVKNGYTEEALLTNVASAKRGDTELIAVVLGMENLLWTSSMQLLDYGFSHFETRLVVRKGEQVGEVTAAKGFTVPVKAASDLWVTVPVGTLVAPQRRLTPAAGLADPIREGAPAGTLTLRVDGREVGSVPVVSAAGIEVVTLTAAARTADRDWTWLLVSAVPLVLLGLLTRRRKRSLS